MGFLLLNTKMACLAESPKLQYPRMYFNNLAVILCEFFLEVMGEISVNVRAIGP